MTKKELEKKIEELDQEVWENKYQREEKERVLKELEVVKKQLYGNNATAEHEITLLEYRIRELQLRLDIVTLTPEQLERLKQVKEEVREDRYRKPYRSTALGKLNESDDIQF